MKIVNQKINTKIDGRHCAVNLQELNEGKPIENRQQITNAVGGIVQRIKNDATGVDPADLASLQALATLDVELLADESQEDISTQFFHEINLSAPTSESILVREAVDPTGEFQVIKGTNDRFPLMDIPPIGTDSVLLSFHALGFKDSIRNELANTLFDFTRVTRQAARAYINDRNRDFFTPLFAATYGTANQQAYDTSGTTLDQKIYNTLVAAMQKTAGLNYKLYHNVKTHELGGRFKIIVNGLTAIRVKPVAEGKIAPGSAPQVLAGLDADIVVWNGLKSYSYYGGKAPERLPVADNVAYVCFVPDSQESLLRVIVEDLYYKSGEGSVLEGSSREDGWFRYTGTFTKYFFPVDNTGNGCVVKAALA